MTFFLIRRMYRLIFNMSSSNEKANDLLDRRVSVLIGRLNAGSFHFAVLDNFMVIGFSIFRLMFWGAAYVLRESEVGKGNKGSY